MKSSPARRLVFPLSIALGAALCLTPVAASASAPPTPSAPSVPLTPAAPRTTPTSSKVLGAKTTTLIVKRSGKASQTQMRSMLTGEQSSLGIKVRQNLSIINAVSVEVPTGKAASVIARLRKQSGVARVDVAKTRQFFDSVPNDHGWVTQAPYLGGYNTSTGVGGVDAPKAWDTSKGDGVTIAVLDSGTTDSNPELAGKITGEYNAYYGYDTNMTDQVGHGTIVDGIAAAATNNGAGYAGAGYNADILAVKIADDQGGISTASEIAGIQYAVDNGAKIINLSIGSPDSDPDEQAAIQYATDNGVLVVASAGNNGDVGDPEMYPAHYAGVLAVGATDALGHRATFSESGWWVSVGAPGVGIVSTAAPHSFITPGTSYYTPTGGESGTSFSAPIVAGEAALLWSKFPDSSEAEIRSAIVNSAHGYAGQGLGTGQVDFANAFLHLAPHSVPTITAPESGATVSDNVTLTATSTAPAVQFQVGSLKIGGPVPVVGGVATTTWASNGYVNGTVPITATDCGVGSECSPSGPVQTTVTLANANPVLTSPVAGTLSGAVHLSATSSAGGVAFLVDGTRVAFDGTAPYSAVIGSLSDITHSITAQQCNTAGTVCSGTVSDAVSVTTSSLHPVSTALAPNPFSPNGDKVYDTSATSLTVPGSIALTGALSVINSAGVVVDNHTPLGALAPGKHTIAWSGKSNNGQTIGNGTYTVLIELSDGTHSGAVVGTTVVDLTKPTISGTAGGGRTFYPVPDKFYDNFVPTTNLSEKSTLSLVVTTATGAGVRTISALHNAGYAYQPWTGYNSAGHLTPAGTYRWHWVARDLAGNTTVSPTYSVTISWKKLVAKTANVVHYADQYQFTPFILSQQSADCVVYGIGSQQYYTHGLGLQDQCPTSGPPYTGTGVAYRVTVPSATVYNTIGVSITGFSPDGEAMLFAGFNRTSPYRSDAQESDLQDYPHAGVFLSNLTTATTGLGTVGAQYHVSKDHYVYPEIDLTNQNSSGWADYDFAVITVIVHYQVLQ